VEFEAAMSDLVKRLRKDAADLSARRADPTLSPAEQALSLEISEDYIEAAAEIERLEAANCRELQTVVEAEREACAKIAAEIEQRWRKEPYINAELRDAHMSTACEIAVAIRARSSCAQQIPQSDQARLARPPAPDGNGTTVGAQPVAR
jgi:hypothetical protein